MELLGGVWSRGAPCLEGLVFDDLGYYPTHFNDFPSAMVTTWALLMVNNYWVYMDAAYNCIAHVQWWQATHPTPSPNPRRVASLLIAAGAKLDVVDRWGHRLGVGVG